MTAGTVYGFKFTLDDASETEVQFTVDSSNTRFGGRNGILDTLRKAIATATSTRGGNLYGYKVDLSIVSGKLRLTSGSNMYPHDGTFGSRVSINATGGGFSASGGTVFNAGIFPTAVLGAVAPVLPPDTITDINGISHPNVSAMLMDDGYGNVGSPNSSLGRGTIDYSSGRVQIFGGLPVASFVIGANTQSALSGVPTSTTCLQSIKARSTNQKRNAQVHIVAFN